jgi:hypothetical protein
MCKKSNLNRRSPARKAPGLACDELMLQPWFLTSRVQRRITGLVPPSYRQKMRDFYDDYGCMICGGSDGNHYANGMCIVCNGSVRRRLSDCAEASRYKVSIESEISYADANGISLEIRERCKKSQRARLASKSN